MGAKATTKAKKASIQKQGIDPVVAETKFVLPPSLRSTPPSFLPIALTLIGLVHQVAERMQLEQELQQLTTEERVHSQMQQAMQRCSKPADNDRVCVVC